MKRDEIRRKLIDGTIQVIANEGLDKASTKLIGTTTGVNEAYIYRCFADKEDLFAKVFDALDDEFFRQSMKHMELLPDSTVELELRCRQYFFSFWNFLLQDRNKCLTYVQYFYSPYFIRYSVQGHEQRFAPLVKSFRTVFKDEADVWMILNHILNVMLDFAVKVHQGQMSEADDYAEHVFRVIYASVKQYFRE